MRDELELIRAAAAGDRRAFDELVRLKRERVVRTAYQITGDLDDALDVAQGVLPEAVAGPRTVRPASPLRHLAVQDHRERRHRHAPLPRPSRHAAAACPTTPAELEPLADRVGRGARSTWRRLQQAFLRLAGALAPQQRAAFVLREIEGLETAEVARVMGVTESTVRNHLLQARRVLRAGLERDYPDLVPRQSRGDGGEGR